MPVSAHLRPPLLITALILLLLPVSCTPFGTSAGLGGDPCLLRDYQGHGQAIVGRLQGAVNSLEGRVDALQAPKYTIDPSTQDISETLSALSEFQVNLDTQMRLIDDTNAQTPPGITYPSLARQAVGDFDTGAWMLTQAYVDDAAGATRAAGDIGIAARVWVRRGLLLLDRANYNLATLHTASPNC